MAIEVRGSIRASNVIQGVSQLIAERGTPTFLRSDNGPEFVATVLQDWLRNAGVEAAYIPPGSLGRMALTRASPTLLTFIGT